MIDWEYISALIGLLFMAWIIAILLIAPAWLWISLKKWYWRKYGRSYLTRRWQRAIALEMLKGD